MFARILFIVILFSAPCTFAQDAPIPPEPNTQTKLTKKFNEEKQDFDNKNVNYLSFSFENDSIGGGTDQAYTNGVRLTWFNASTRVPAGMDTLADYVPTFDINPTTSTVFTFGQNMYTPEDITVRNLQPDDRPYAGWLYGSIGLLTATDNHLDELDLTLGIVGPEAMAEPVQEFVHDAIDTRDPSGWDNQLDFEPGVIVSWRRRWPAALAHTMGDYRVAVEPNVNVSLGNIYTYAGTGVNFTFGPYQGVLQDTPPRVAPAGPGTGYFETPDQGWSWYLFAGVDGRAVARNIFLDGNTFTDSHSVDKKYLVGDANVGAALTLGDYRLSYTLTGRTKEFDGQENDSLFGSLTLTTRF